MSYLQRYSMENPTDDKLYASFSYFVIKSCEFIIIYFAIKYNYEYYNYYNLYLFLDTSKSTRVIIFS